MWEKDLFVASSYLGIPKIDFQNPDKQKKTPPTNLVESVKIYSNTKGNSGSDILLRYF